MKAYLPFGDWSDDGHGKYDKVLIEIDSMMDLLFAENRIKEKYGQTFFENYANVYEEPKLSETCWQALIDNNMPITLLQVYDGCWNWDKLKDIKEISEEDKKAYLELEFIEQSFIWLLNQYGANITVLPEENGILQINNWTCPGFETVGYGCFY